MQKHNTNVWVRMALGFAAVLLVGGAGMALAIGPNPRYDHSPLSSFLVGPSIKPGQTANYALEVKLDNGTQVYFPPTSGARFSVLRGSITSLGAYTAPASGPRDRISGTFAANGITTSASRVIAIQ